MERISIFALFLITFTFSNCSQTTIWERGKIIDNVAEVNNSGSGYRELEGKFIDYQYVDFGSFRLAIYDNTITWYGYEGYFKDITAQVSPQISKVSEGIYFLSWLLPTGGGDNVVVNFNTNKVFAHLHQVDAKISADFELIHGEVICGPSTDCEFSPGKITSVVNIIRLLKSNTKAFGLPAMGSMERPLIAEHITARDELAGSLIQYTTKSGTISFQLNDATTHVTDETGTKQAYKTHATKIDEGVYFISWLANENFGEHIVFNINTKQIFDHILPDGTNQQQIYPVAKIEQH